MKRLDFTREIDGKREEVTAEIIPSAIFGLPITADQDKWLALQKIITNILQSDGKIANPIRFKSADLIRLLNNNTKTGKNYKEVSDWLDVMSSTTIISNGVVYVADQKRFARDRFRVFDRAVSVGKEMEDGTIADANYVWLSAWQLENINQNYLLPIDLETYRELKNYIAKALVPLLQVWLYATQKVGLFEKRYEELCEILTLQTYRVPSLILRQLKPSLDELVHHGYIEKWRIEKTSDRKAYKVVFFHGPKFHRDRRKRLEQKAKIETPIVIAESEPEEPSLPLPGTLEGKMKTLPIEQGSVSAPQPNTVSGGAELVDELAARGLMPSVALKLLGSIEPSRLAGVVDYLDYWDSLKTTKEVGPGLLYELIKNGDPLPAGFETRRHKAQRMEAEDRRKQTAQIEAARRTKYETYCRQVIDRAVEDLPPGEFEHRVSIRRNEMANQPGIWNEGLRPEMADQLARHAVRAAIAEMVNVPTYADLKGGEISNIPGDLKSNASELELSLPNSNPETETAPDALYGPPANDLPPNGDIPNSEENSSPRSI